MEKLTVKSPAFEPNKQIPKKYSCNGDDVNPPLTIEGIPQKTKSLALTLEDPDAPSGTFDHWVVWNIPPSTNKIAEHTVPGREGLNSMRQYGYTGPCPPSGTHRYFFKVYALDTELALGTRATKKDLEKAFVDHIVAKGELMGVFNK